MELEQQYNEVIRLIRLIRAAIMINYSNSDTRIRDLNSVINIIGKEADSRHSDGYLLDDLVEKLQALKESLYSIKE